MATDEAARLRGRYLDLLRDTLTCTLWDGRDGSVWRDHTFPRRMLASLLANQRLEIVRTLPPERRQEGQDWPRLAHSMIGVRRMDNLRMCVETVLADGVPGDLIETGVWRGGACIFMRGVLAAHEVTDRTVWVADSFAGLPKPDAGRYPADAHDRHHTHDVLAVSMAEVQENFRRFGLLDEQVRFLKGWFRDTLPTAPIERLAVLRLDGDMYESTLDALNGLYDRLSDGGFCVIDDYGLLERCQRAVTDFRAARGITEPLVPIDSSGVYWRKGVRETSAAGSATSGPDAVAVRVPGPASAESSAGLSVS
ncbi:TylF/MycF family methyltransferase [Frankia sp. CNm7]|uniref:TylF/MycF family methyltransferase n=1 Tax=Frankia nepalensis TaxID=1836974 RepID=A0A937RHR0_9ACTN|nr:TylF/MycF family methyltransferase [Frankia nepalensis]MBL7502674.1 TylF/MycF family methyltransferase [Frankia nepalensis]MBL7515534.1 TylF/MycF family methyltransferase [Frankia nepalensis]MBL7522787.1 TylF/MycF family methyltransferase [Frankia nepalensis]MBL7629059.1 TylF/MycF family methyltransferase [Frankia nepalensis]